MNTKSDQSKYKNFSSGFRINTKRHLTSNSLKYTRIVTFLKLFLPMIASILIAMILIWPQLISEKERFKINIGTPVFSRAEKLRMVNAKFFATDNKNQPYSLTADLAMEVEPGSMIVELTAPKADIMLADSAWVAATAARGVFAQKEEILNLQNGVSIFHDHGYQLEIDNITIDLKKNTAFSEDPVVITAPFGYIKGDGLLVTDKGDKIKITGKTKVILYDILKGSL